MRNFLLAVAILTAGVYLVLPRSRLDQLMEVNGPASAPPGSGLELIDPAKDSANSVHALAVPGLITVVEFQDRKCPACSVSRTNLKKLVAIRPDVAVRVVDITDFGWRQSDDKYGVAIWSVPYTVIIGRDGQIVAENSKEDPDASTLLYDWIGREVSRHTERRLAEGLFGP